jgi:chaperonin cofactor prefoldin
MIKDHEHTISELSAEIETLNKEIKALRKKANDLDLSSIKARER